MSEKILSRSQENKKVKRESRGLVLQGISEYLLKLGFEKQPGVKFTKRMGSGLCEISFQYKSYAYNIDVWCTVTRDEDKNNILLGPESERFAQRKKYDFRCSPLEDDIQRCTSEYCRYLLEIVMSWFYRETSDKNKDS